MILSGMNVAAGPKLAAVVTNSGGYNRQAHVQICEWCCQVVSVLLVVSVSLPSS